MLNQLFCFNSYKFENGFSYWWQWKMGKCKFTEIKTYKKCDFWWYLVFQVRLHIGQLCFRVQCNDMCLKAGKQLICVSFNYFLSCDNVLIGLNWLYTVGSRKYMTMPFDLSGSCVDVVKHGTYPWPMYVDVLYQTLPESLV